MSIRAYSNALIVKKTRAKEKYISVQDTILIVQNDKMHIVDKIRKGILSL